jgi:flagellar basal-body rod protein FlgB
MTTLFSSINPLANALDYHVERHNLIASNVANVDTPGYRPREITFAEHLSELGGSMPLARTSHAHMRPDGSVNESGFQVYEETWATPGNDGNYVRLEHEMSRMNANSVRYSASTQMVNMHLGMIRYAIGSGR